MSEINTQLQTLVDRLDVLFRVLKMGKVLVENLFLVTNDQNVQTYVNVVNSSVVCTIEFFQKQRFLGAKSKWEPLILDPARVNGFFQLLQKIFWSLWSSSELLAVPYAFLKNSQILVALRLESPKSYWFFTPKF